MPYWHPIPEDVAIWIYTILEEEAGASHVMLKPFVQAQVEGCTEYRFGGTLGMGGKFWNNGDRWYVDYYAEHQSPERDRIVDACNRRIDEHWRGANCCDICGAQFTTREEDPWVFARMLSGPRKSVHVRCIPRIPPTHASNPG